MELTKNEYIYLKSHGQMHEILWRRFLEITDGSLGIPRELFLAKVQSISEDIKEGGPMKMTKLITEVLYHYEIHFDLTWISHKNEVIFAGSREDMFIAAT